MKLRVTLAIGIKSELQNNSQLWPLLSLCETLQNIAFCDTNPMELVLIYQKMIC